LGICLLFLAVFSAIVYAVVLKKLLKTYNPITIIAWQEMIGAIYFLPLFLFFDAGTVLSVEPSANALISLLMLAVFASAVSYVLYAMVIQNMDLSKANIYVNLIPVFAAITAFFVLDEKFSVLKIMGMILVIFGVMLSQRNGSKQKA
jgi:drug/metabolite transporter (DMT)-like permease